MILNLVLLLTSLIPFDGVVGYAALNLDTGQHFAERGDKRFPMGSVFKFPTAIALMRRVDAGEFKLDQSVTITPDEFSLDSR